MSWPTLPLLQEHLLGLDEVGHRVHVVRVVLTAGQEGDHQQLHLQGQTARVEMSSAAEAKLAKSDSDSEVL